MFSDNFFKKVEKKTNVNKETILSLADKLQKGNMKDETTLKKIISTILNDNVPKNLDKFLDK